MDYKFQRTRIDKLSREKMVEELENVAKSFNYIEFGWRDFNKVANISATPVKKEFGTWSKALSALREHLKEKNLNLSPRKIPCNQIHSDNDMFNEMERIWKNLGHRPSRAEWERSNYKIAYGTYKNRFNGWQHACLKFIEYKMGENIIADTEKIIPTNKKYTTLKDKSEATRIIPLGIRLQVLNRDSYRCVFCGRSPATEVGVKLHIDHIEPFSKGGKNTPDNLQTLCSDCNLGKSDRTFTGK